MLSTGGFRFGSFAIAVIFFSDQLAHSVSLSEFESRLALVAEFKLQSIEVIW